jgi:hypothetical protein
LGGGCDAFSAAPSEALSEGLRIPIPSIYLFIGGLARAYGWTIPQISALTLTQARNLRKVVEFQTYQDRRIYLEIARISQAAERDVYDRFVDGLKPSFLSGESPARSLGRSSRVSDEVSDEVSGEVDD